VIEPATETAALSKKLDNAATCFVLALRCIADFSVVRILRGFKIDAENTGSVILAAENV